jgi:hypothetical protein
MSKKLIILWCIIALLTDAAALKVQITEPKDGAVISTLRVSVNGTITDGSPPYSIFWRSDRDEVLDNVPHTEPYLPNFWLPSLGTHRLALEVKDSTGATASDAVTVTVVEPQLNIRILSPAEGTVIGDVHFSAEVSGSPPYKVKWTSDKDGVLGETETFSKALSSGEHQITLKVIDSAAVVKYETVKVLVRHRPDVWILSPTGDERNEMVQFAARVTGGSPPYRLEWTSDKDGVLGNAERFTKALSLGDHLITLRATDAGGVQNTQTLRMSAIRPISVEISSPKAGSLEGDIVFNATVYGGKPPYNLKWESSKEGFLSNTESFVMRLSEGEHNISVEVIDDDYFMAHDAVDIGVQSTDYAGYAAVFILILIVAAVAVFFIRLRRES